ncbi:serine/threonine-protein kinase [Streptomyces sp. NPDC089919]|uniref:serine/threonine-protein kinase n=1 Tax=Streptomyces sp. NPDC089919 TaxID=3155188 RepID=UPI0034403FD4
MRDLKAADPRAIGPYRLLAELGRGGMGRVLLGAGPDGRLAAVKQVHARIAADEEFRARFRREVAASRKVSGAFTAAVLDADAEAATPWLASVFVTGPSLGAVVDRVGPLPEETVRRLAAGLATALVEIHRAGLVHRDLKPDNVLLAEDGVRVIDFGIARADDGRATELTQSGVVVGSPAFMSPEQAEAGELTAASDVFALGSVLAFAATGRSPFARGSVLQTLYDLVHEEPDLSGVPAGLRELVTACLTKDPAGRPTPQGVLELLGSAPPAGPWPPAVRDLVAAQQAEVDRVLGSPERTVLDGVPSVGGSAVAAGGVPVAGGSAGGGTVVAPGGAAGPDRGRRIRRVTAVAGAVVVLGVLAAGGRLLWGGSGGGSGGGGGTAGVRTADYATMPTCEEMADGSLLGPRDATQDYHVQDGKTAQTSCTWHSADPGSDEVVDWSLNRAAGATSAVVMAQRDFARRVADLEAERDGKGIADEQAVAVGMSDGTGCRLGVRSANLTIWVIYRGRAHPASGCRAEALRTLRGALASMPH